MIVVAYPFGCDPFSFGEPGQMLSRTECWDAEKRVVPLMNTYSVCVHIASLVQKVMTMLHELFCKLDMACEKYGVYKVETIGDVSPVEPYPAYHLCFASLMCSSECCISCVGHPLGVLSLLVWLEL